MGLSHCLQDWVIHFLLLLIPVREGWNVFQHVLTHKHKRQTHYWQFRGFISPRSMSLDCGRKVEHLESTQGRVKMQDSAQIKPFSIWLSEDSVATNTDFVVNYSFNLMEPDTCKYWSLSDWTLVIDYLKFHYVMRFYSCWFPQRFSAHQCQKLLLSASCLLQQQLISITDIWKQRQVLTCRK